MATRTTSLAAINNTDAAFRAWINEIHSSLIAFGWIQTADTGQINFATVTRPAAINTYQGYALYRMADANQASCAVFIRLDFGTGGNADCPSIKFQMAIGGTNGSGSLTGNLCTQQTLQTDTNNATPVNCRTAGTTSSFRMSFWEVNGAGKGFCLIIERDLDTAGNETALGVQFCAHWYAPGPTEAQVSQFLEQAGGTGAVDTLWYGMVSTQTSQGGGGNVGVGPVRTQLGPFRNPMKTLILFARSDFAMEVTTPVTIYGASHTYLTLRPRGGSSPASRALNTWQADCGYMLLWE
jgi:hypothetical protein